MKPMYHITSQAEAEVAARSGEYAPQGFDTEGFIHCSYAHQLTRVAAAHFRGRHDMILFEIDRSSLPCDVVDENLDGGTDLFPHIYGHLPMASVVRTHVFPCSADGSFELPSSLRPAGS